MKAKRFFAICLALVLILPFAAAPAVFSATTARLAIVHMPQFTMPVISDQIVGSPVHLNAGHFPGFQFNYWTTSPVITGIHGSHAPVINNAFLMLPQDVIVTAHWTPIHYVHGQIPIWIDGMFFRHARPGEAVNISPGIRPGYTFNGWQPHLGVIFGNPALEHTWFMMPNHTVNLQPNWIPIDYATIPPADSFRVTVHGSSFDSTGDGSGWFAPGDVVTIRTETRPEHVFGFWWSVPGIVFTTGATTTTATFIMPAHHIDIIAEWAQIGQPWLGGFPWQWQANLDWWIWQQWQLTQQWEQWWLLQQFFPNQQWWATQADWQPPSAPNAPEPTPRPIPTRTPPPTQLTPIIPPDRAPIIISPQVLD